MLCCVFVRLGMVVTFLSDLGLVYVFTTFGGLFLLVLTLVLDFCFYVR